MRRRLMKGDTIKCRDKDDAVETMQYLSKLGIETDFGYDLHGEEGIYLIVTKGGKVKNDGEN